MTTQYSVVSTYTVYRFETDEILGRSLPVEEAMNEILTYDGYRYEIRCGTFQDVPIWNLYHSDGSENSCRGADNLLKTTVFSFEKDEVLACRDIARQIIAAKWPRMPECITDEEYAARQAEIGREIAEGV